MKRRGSTNADNEFTKRSHLDIKSFGAPVNKGLAPPCSLPGGGLSLQAPCKAPSHQMPTYTTWLVQVPAAILGNSIHFVLPDTFWFHQGCKCSRTNTACFFGSSEPAVTQLPSCWCCVRQKGRGSLCAAVGLTGEVCLVSLGV